MDGTSRRLERTPSAILSRPAGSFPLGATSDRMVHASKMLAGGPPGYVTSGSQYLQWVHIQRPAHAARFFELGEAWYPAVQQRLQHITLSRL